jgi:hypothetical protein
VLDGIDFAERGIGHRHCVAEVIAGGAGEMALKFRDVRTRRARAFLCQRQSLYDGTR